MSRREELSQQVTASLDSLASPWVLAVCWAAMAVLWAVLIARQRPQNASFAWRSMTAAVCVLCGGQCAARLLIISGDVYTSELLDHVNAVWTMATIGMAVMFRANLVWSGDRSPEAYAYAVRERGTASVLEMKA